ncbi:hypothetical protein BFJ63_vAg16063 [Fusarium oxysporum f. sp. narcissi]|uniref:Kinesin light chain n=1 Tax=Fusarium oxysporum f. sp. narcissi TaxID=451672 RepID=A0A4Q2V345_FUSOX|nr:hypothetical protein BFJ63_vAg16063 [Fusarium oxysporum f. sp. narcissi]
MCAVCQSLLPHVEPLVGRKPRKEGIVSNWAEVLTNESWYMLMIGEYLRAEMLAKAAVQARICILGLDHLSTLNSMANLASTYRNQGRWEEAEKLDTELMETRKAKLGVDHPDTLASIANLALTRHSQSALEDSPTLMQGCAHLRQKKLGHNHPDTQSSIATLHSWQASRLALEGPSGC